MNRIGKIISYKHWVFEIPTKLFISIKFFNSDDAD